MAEKYEFEAMEHDQLSDPSRLAVLRKFGLLDTPPEDVFDQLTRVAARVTKSPMALVSIVDVDRQFLKSRIGSLNTGPARRETPISHSFCQYAVISKEPLIIPDAREHPLVKDNPAVTEYGVIAYLGVPLVTPEGYALGTLCVLDSKPREWQEEHVEVLRSLASAIISTLNSRASGNSPPSGSADGSDQPLPSWARRLAIITSEHIRALDSYDECIRDTDGTLKSFEREKHCREAMLRTENELRSARADFQELRGVDAGDSPDLQAIVKLWGAYNSYLDAKDYQADIAQRFVKLEIGLDDLAKASAATLGAEQALRSALYDLESSRE
jgi:hypothetical protein